MLLPKHLIFLFLFLFSSALSAEIAITRYGTDPNGDANSCDGTIALKANGSAGPFTVIFPAMGSRGEVVLTEVNGEITVDDLCRGFYEIQVYPTRFPSCVTILEVSLVLSPSKTDKALAAYEEKVTGAEMRINVSPNPSDGRVTLDISGGEQLPTLTANRDWSVTVLGASGKVFHKQSAPPKADGAATEQTFQLNLENLTAGIYFVQVIRPDGLEGRARVILR